MLIVFLRTIIIYFAILMALRIMGKGELSSMSPFQMIVIFMIAELGTIPIDDPSKPLLSGIMAIFTLVFLQTIISMVSIKSELFRKILKGKPSLLIEKGKINVKELKAMRITINDLVEQLRIEGVPSISDIDYAILEANGNITVLPKSNKQPVTGDFFDAPVKEQGLPLVIMSDGKLYNENLTLSGIGEKDLEKAMKRAGIKKSEEVFMAFADENSILHLYTKPDSSSGDYTKEALQ